MPPKRKSASEVPVQEVSSHRKPGQGTDNDVFDFEHASTVPTASSSVKNSTVEPAKKKDGTPRKPRGKKQALSKQEPVVTESSSQYLEGGPLSSAQITDGVSQEPPPVKKPRKSRAKKQEVQEVHRDPLSIENLLIPTHQEPETSSPFVPEVAATPEKKPRKPRAKKQTVHSDPLSIDNLLIHTPQEPETAQTITQFINVTDATPARKQGKSNKVTSQPSHEEDNSIAHSSSTNHQEIESQELTIISQEQPVKKQRKPRAKKQEHSTIDNATLSDQPIEVDNVINNAQQVFDVQMKPKTTSTRAPRAKKSKVSEDAHPESDGASAHTASSTKRGRPRKEKASEVTPQDNTNVNASSSLASEANEHTQKVPASKRGRPRKEKNSEIMTTGNDSEASSAVVVKENDGTNAHAEEHLQRAPSSKRGRPRKEKQVETNSTDEHPVDSQVPGERSAEEDSSKKRRGRPKKDDLPKAVTQNNDSTHEEPFSEASHIPSSAIVKSESKKKDKNSDSPPEDLHSLGQKGEHSSSVGAGSIDIPSTHNETEVNSQGDSYPSERDVIKEEYQHYYGSSLDVLASVSVGDTIMQGVSDISKGATEETDGESKDVIMTDVHHSTESQGQQSTSKEEVTGDLQIAGNENNKETIEHNVVVREVGDEDIATSEDDDEQESSKKLTPAEKMEGRLAQFQKLRGRMDDAEQANRQELYDEHQRKKINPREKIRQERKREEAEKLLARQEAEENGEDYERKQFWSYSVDSVERWEKKQEKKLKRSDIAFTDYNQVAHKKYKRMINDFTPDLSSYNAKKEAARASASLVTTEDGEVVPIDAESRFYRDANSLQYASVDDQPGREAIDRLVNDVEKQIERREKFSRQKTVNEDDDITYINERNRKFNEKIGRFYDKYTQEIKENFERGTAL